MIELIELGMCKSQQMTNKKKRGGREGKAKGKGKAEGRGRE
jgi:hypothetical protein